MVYPGLINSLQVEAGIHGVGKSSGKDFATVPVDYSSEVDKPSGHGKIGDVHGPHLIGAIDLHVP
jgi:hypothetical protein